MGHRDAPKTGPSGLEVRILFPFAAIACGNHGGTVMLLGPESGRLNLGIFSIKQIVMTGSPLDFR